ncbi:unclassified head protein [Pseudomonas phage pphageT12]|uniref:Unclassified head protein n=1 Tax=Pseudomonas phage phiB1_1 TaxID=2755402 RepID=A0A7D7FQ20_9CAUD|nr:unclassified head protein [Pseudomonas phage phiB1_1]UAW53798.1 unclassified head protein [Pseudomonas phage pphageT12]UAW53857.1 unclassified head protein [Pseudomonas phage pphageBV72]
MFWMLAATAAMSALQTGMANKEKASQIKAQNKVNRAADLQTLTNNAQNINSLLVQNGQLRVSAAREYNAAEQEAYKAKGTTVANAAAAQIKGASVDATLSDIDRELSEAEVSTEQNFEVGQYNLQQSLRQMTYAAENSLRGNINPSSGQQSPLVNGLMAAGSSYMSSAFRFGSTGT